MRLPAELRAARVCLAEGPRCDFYYQLSIIRCLSERMFCRTTGNTNSLIKPFLAFPPYGLCSCRVLLADSSLSVLLRGCCEIRLLRSAPTRAVFAACG